mmetsp:Transcript_11313/g.35046  ORF Transcript_11313/g.35046 Transcript_11313/m.35046 type:complete len:220 (+) Transcript_11313:1679-2338(+)
MPQLGLRNALHVGQHEAADLLRRHLFASQGLHHDARVVGRGVGDDLEREALHLLPHLRLNHLLPEDALDVVERVLGVLGGLHLGGLAHQTAAILGESHEGGRGPAAALVLQDLHVAVAPNSATAEGRAKVYANHGGLLRGRHRGLSLCSALRCLLLAFLLQAFLLLRCCRLGCRKALKHCSVGRLELQALLVRGLGCYGLLVREESGPQPRVALGPGGV